MSKILIVGHPNSGYRDVEGVLHKHGMKRANPSRREGFQAYEISNILCRAHHAPDLNTINSENDIRQIDAKPVWNGVILDLLLGNLEHEVWGWSDPNAIFLLEHWKQIDPDIIFMMVYDSPYRFLGELTADEIPKISSHTVKRFFDNWSAYNKHMLRFFLRNQERCFMVHAQQARSETTRYLNALSSHIDLQLPSRANGSALNHIQQNGVASAEQRAIIPRPTAPETDRYFMACIMDVYPEYNQHYEELQSSANLPLHDTLLHDPCPLNAWLANMKQQSRTTDLVSQLSGSHIQQLKEITALKRMNNELNVENERLLALLHDIREKRIQGDHDKQSLKQQGNNLSDSPVIGTTNNTEELKMQLRETTEENELLLSQLNKVQEKLERYYFENRKLKQHLHPKYYGAAERVKEHLSYRLGAVMIQRSRSLSGWLTMPFALLREQQAFYRNNIDKKNRKLPPINTYQDAEEAEKVKKHLSYRLGAIMVHYGSSPVGWLKMPFLMGRAIKAFRLEREQAYDHK